MIKFKKGDILKDSDNLPDATFIVIPVNTVGTMGKGLAKQFGDKHPSVRKTYRNMCQFNQISRGGDIFIIKDFIMFATKENWRRPSKYSYIAKGLENIIDHFCDISNERLNGVLTIKIPKLGCGLGGLDYNIVKTIYEEFAKDMITSRYLRNSGETIIEIYE